MTGMRAAILIALALVRMDAGVVRADRWEVEEEVAIPIPNGAHWELTDWDGDGVQDLVLLDQRTIRIKRQITRSTWRPDDPFTVDDSYVAWDVLDSFTNHHAPTLILVGRDSFQLLSSGAEGVSYTPAYPVRMPYGSAADSLMRFPFGLRVPGVRAFAIPSTDSLLLITSGERSSINRGVQTKIRGRRSSVVAPHIFPGHWDGDGLVDLIMVEDGNLTIYRGSIDGAFATREPLRISFDAGRLSSGERAESVRITVCDLDSDGLSDLIVTGVPNDPVDSYLSIAVHRNQGDGCGPAPDHILMIDSWGRLLPIHDRNNDGLADIRIQTTATGTSALLRALASGSVSIRTRLYTQTADGNFERQKKGEHSVQASWKDDRRAPVRFDDAEDWNNDGVRDMLIVSGNLISLHQTTRSTSVAMTETSRWQSSDYGEVGYRAKDIDCDGVIDFAYSTDKTESQENRKLRIAFGRVR